MTQKKIIFSMLNDLPLIFEIVKLDKIKVMMEKNNNAISDIRTFTNSLNVMSSRNTYPKPRIRIT